MEAGGESPGRRSQLEGQGGHPPFEHGRPSFSESRRGRRHETGRGGCETLVRGGHGPGSQASVMEANVPRRRNRQQKDFLMQLDELSTACRDCGTFENDRDLSLILEDRCFTVQVEWTN